ncbi:MAG: hypothetical protein AAFW82_03195 [Pseudomonadota bacterium]
MSDIKGIGDEIAGAINTAHVESSDPGNSSPSGGVDNGDVHSPVEANVVDIAGTRFNPAVHRQHPDGGPIKTKSGTFARKPGVKKPLNIPRPEPDVGAVSMQADTVEPKDFKKVADGLLRTVEAVPVSIMGPHWALTSGERKAFAPHVEKICEDSGIDDMPPWIALTILGLAYTSSRLAMPETATRVEQIKRGLLTRGLSAGYKYVKSWFNPGTERMRQDDIGATSPVAG